MGGATLPAAIRSHGIQGSGTLSPKAWMPRKDLDLEAWMRAGQRLGTMTRCSQWWLGDWIRYGTLRWGEKYKEAARITGVDPRTLRNIAYVAGSVEVSRRRDNLSWSHHAEVSSLEPAEQEKWLTLAESEGMSVSDLRTELRAARRGASEVSGPSESAKTHAGFVRCPACKHLFEPLPS